MWERLSTGRLKIARSLGNLRRELRLYHRDERGRIVKANDHGVDAMRYLMLSGAQIACVEAPVRCRCRRSFIILPVACGADARSPYAGAWHIAVRGEPLSCRCHGS